MAISKEQIFEVADELDAAGQNPTLAAVRKALDGGSYTTISEAMKEWRAAKAAPPGVMDKLSEVGSEIWGVALELANGRLASEREGLEAARLEMEASRLEAVELADQLSAELDDSRNQVASLEGVAQELREADKNRQALDRVQAAAEKAAKDHKAELAQAQGEAKQAAKEHQKEIEALRAQHSKALENAQEAKAAAQSEVERLTAATSSLEYKLAQAEEKLAGLAGEVEKATKERDSALEAAGTAREQAAALRGRVEGLEIALSRGEKDAGSQK